jgi:hypothetical protein
MHFLLLSIELLQYAVLYCLGALRYKNAKKGRSFTAPSCGYKQNYCRVAQYVLKQPFCGETFLNPTLSGAVALFILYLDWKPH